MKDSLIMTFNAHVFSFGAGLIGSLVYMRMLGSSVDSMVDGAKGLIKYVLNDLLYS